MSTFVELARNAASATRLFALLECGQIADVIQQVEYAAARDAFHRVPSAIDKRAQVQICIGHLNSAFSACAHTIESAGFLDKTLMSRATVLGLTQDKACFFLCMRAVCYAYLGESQMSREDLKLARCFRAKTFESGASAWWLFSGAIFNPIAACDMAYTAFRALGQSDGNEFDLDMAFIEELDAILSPKEPC